MRTDNKWWKSGDASRIETTNISRSVDCDIHTGLFHPGPKEPVALMHRVAKKRARGSGRGLAEERKRVTTRHNLLRRFGKPGLCARHTCASMPASIMGGSGRSVGNQVEQKASNLCMKRTFWKAAPVVVFALVSIGCGGEPGHHGTPSDPNEEQGNPKAQPEKSI